MGGEAVFTPFFSSPPSPLLQMSLAATLSHLALIPILTLGEPAPWSPWRSGPPRPRGLGSCWLGLIW